MVKRLLLSLGVVSLGAGLWVRMGESRYMASLVALFAIYALAATGLNCVVGWVGEISVGHAGVMAIGGYLGSQFIGPDGSPHLALGIALLSGTLAGTLLGLPSIRVSGFGLAIYTFVFGQGIRMGLGEINQFGGHFGEPVSRFVVASTVIEGRAFAILSLSVLAVGVGVAILIGRSLLGTSWFAVRENEAMAMSLGISPRRVRIAAFALSGAYAGVAGLLLAVQLRYIAPQLFPLFLSINLLAMVIIGGRRSIFGPLLGALLFVVAQDALPNAESSAIIFGLVMAGAVWVLPRGVTSLGSLRSVQNSIGKRTAISELGDR